MLNQILLTFVVLAVGSLAAPVDDAHLVRPSPINPDVPSDPKPEEKITLISNPKEQSSDSVKPVAIAATLPGPYKPAFDHAIRSVRADKDSSGSNEDSSEEKDKQQSLSRASSTPSSETAKPVQLPSVFPVTSSEDHQKNKRDIAVPSTPKDQPANDPKQAEQDNAANAGAPKKEVKKESSKHEENNTPELIAHPATVVRPIPVTQLFSKKSASE